MKSGTVPAAMVGKLTEAQVKAAQNVILTHGRELVSPEDYARNRWQSVMAKQVLGGRVSQQLISKFINTGRIAPDTLREILRKLGEDPDEVLGTETASGPDPTDMNPARAKVIWRNAQWYPQEVVADVQGLSLEGERANWTEARWLFELSQRWQQWLLAKSLSNQPK